MTCVICPKLKDCYIVFLDFNLPEDYLIEEDPLVNKFISAKEGVNCAAFIGGVVEAFLRGTGFTAKVEVFWWKHHKTALRIAFAQETLQREKETK
jgi:hypothetical protein